MKELPKVYDPGTVEKRIYEMWQSHGCFKGVRHRKSTRLYSSHAR